MNATEKELELLREVRRALEESRLNAGVLLVDADGELLAMELQDCTEFLTTVNEWIKELEDAQA